MPNTRRHIIAAAGFAALLLLVAPPTATASGVATQQRPQRQHHQHHHVPADAIEMEDAEIVPEIEAQEEGEVNQCPHFRAEAEEVEVEFEVEDEEVVAIDETKLGARLLVPGKEKGADAWKKAVGVVGSWLQKAAPPASDAECDWSWSRLSCAPTADCHFKYQFGDWHLGRSCRLRTAEEKAAAAGGDKTNKVVAAARAVSSKVFGGISAGKEHTTKHVGAFLDRVKQQVKQIQPPSDEDCAFDVRGSVAQRGLVCTPGCQFRFQLGDMSPNHACRRAQEEP